jgi:hypothetical protein
MSGGIPMLPPTQSDKLVSAEALRHYFAPPLSLRTIRVWQAQRIIPYLKVGRRVFFDPSRVREHLFRHREIHPRNTFREVL